MPTEDELLAQLREQEGALGDRMLRLLDEARREMRRKLQALDPDSDAAVNMTAMLRATEAATATLREGLVGALAKGRGTAASLGESLALVSLPASESLVAYQLPLHLVARLARWEGVRADGVTGELRDTISNDIRIGMLSGDTLPELEKRIALNSKVPRGRFHRAATRIEELAVTATNRVANEAIYDRYQDAAGRIDGLQKMWVTAGDGRVRASHAVLDGVVVPMDGTFDVGGYRGRHPHDELLPLAQTVRCRCRLVATLPEGSD
jgi:hypothetical protein